MKILSVVGARPNFMKIAPFCRALRHGKANVIEHVLVHTGQHYDENMSDAFFKELGIPKPDVNLGIGSGTHAEQVGNTMIAFEKVIRERHPDWVVVVGDVNATCACSITAKKEGVKLAHIEAGLRSGDISMPEEINRLVTDRLSDLLFAPDRLSCENLNREGVPKERIKFVGNIMIDTLEANRSQAERLSLMDVVVTHALDLKQDPGIDVLLDGRFAVITLHRPSNVDDRRTLTDIVGFLTNEVARDMPLIWPVHPRTLERLNKFDLWNGIIASPNILTTKPLGYHEMLRMNLGAKVILTDSGGLQEECCVLGTPCLTLRWNTERPVTLREHGGASSLVGNDVKKIREEYKSILENERQPRRPELWDGHTAERILDELVETCTNHRLT